MQDKNQPTNPFIESMILELVKVNQQVYNHKADYEGLDRIEVLNHFTVEKQEHTKLYHTPYDDKLLFSTSYKTRDLLLYILLNIKKNTDYIDLVQTKVCNKTNLSRNSFYSAVKELTVLNIICKKQIRQYWVNPKYIFNGNRKTFFQEKKPENIKVVHQLFDTIK